MVDVVVIGAGQAGLSAAHHLRRRGVRAEGDGSPDMVVLDANVAPGGAWQHRWRSLTMATVNGIFALPGMPVPEIDRAEPSRAAVPRYFSAYESDQRLDVLRPVRVRSVSAADGSPDGRLVVDTDRGTWSARAVVNATGTWNTPVIPELPGRDRFEGTQLHSRDYVSADAFSGVRVAVVGGGISAVQLLEEISHVAETVWYARREPIFLDHGFGMSEGSAVERRVGADVAAGRPPGSIVSYTGLIWTDYAVAARERGALERRPMFTSIAPRGVVEADGSFTSVDAIVWATGFRADLDHLAPLGLRGPLGGIPMVGTAAAHDPRVHLIGYGPSQSTIGANRAGRAAVDDLLRRIPQLRPA